MCTCLQTPQFIYLLSSFNRGHYLNIIHVSNTAKAIEAYFIGFPSDLYPLICNIFSYIYMYMYNTVKVISWSKNITFASVPVCLLLTFPFCSGKMIRHAPSLEIYSTDTCEFQRHMYTCSSMCRSPCAVYNIVFLLHTCLWPDLQNKVTATDTLYWGKYPSEIQTLGAACVHVGRLVLCTLLLFNYTCACDLTFKIRSLPQIHSTEESILVKSVHTWSSMCRSPCAVYTFAFHFKIHTCLWPDLWNKVTAADTL